MKNITKLVGVQVFTTNNSSDEGRGGRLLGKLIKKLAWARQSLLPAVGKFLSYVCKNQLVNNY